MDILENRKLVKLNVGKSGDINFTMRSVRAFVCNVFRPILKHTPSNAITKQFFLKKTEKFVHCMELNDSSFISKYFGYPNHFQSVKRDALQRKTLSINNQPAVEYWTH